MRLLSLRERRAIASLQTVPQGWITRNPYGLLLHEYGWEPTCNSLGSEREDGENDAGTSGTDERCFDRVSVNKDPDVPERDRFGGIGLGTEIRSRSIYYGRPEQHRKQEGSSFEIGEA